MGREGEMEGMREGKRERGREGERENKHKSSGSWYLLVWTYSSSCYRLRNLMLHNLEHLSHLWTDAYHQR